MQENLDRPRAGPIEVAFKIGNGLIALGPDGLLVTEFGLETFITKHFRMDLYDQNLFIIGAIEDTDFSSSR